MAGIGKDGSTPQSRARNRMSNGWRSARAEESDRVLLSGDGVLTSQNVNERRKLLETLIRDLEAPKARRWTSVVIDRTTGTVSVGTGPSAIKAWRAATS